MIKSIPGIRKGMCKGPEREAHIPDLTSSKEAKGKYSGINEDESLLDLPWIPAYCCVTNSAALH